MPAAFTPENYQPAHSSDGRWSLAKVILCSVVLVSVVTLVKIAAAPYVGERPFLIYFASIMLLAWWGGWRGGLLTSALSGLAGAVFMFPPSTWRSAPLQNLTPLVIFLAEGTAITAITARLRTERRRANRAASDARTALSKLEGVLRGVSDGITVQSPSGDLIYANLAAAKLTGFPSAEALVSASVSEIGARFELLTPEGAPFPINELPGRRALAGLPAPERLVRFKTKQSGEERWALVRANPVTVDASNERYAVNVFQDVTEARLREEELRLSHERFSTTLRSIGDAVIATDGHGAVTFMNVIAERLTGWTQGEAEGRPLAEVFSIVDEATRAPVESPVERVLRDGTVVGLANHTILIARNGSELAIDDSAAPIRSSSGELKGTVLIFRDVSERRDNERRKAFIAEATSELVSSLDYARTLATVAQLAVPRVADWCAVDMYEDGRLHRLAVAHVDPAKVRLVYDIDTRYPEDPQSSNGAYAVARTGQAVFVPHISDAALVEAAQNTEHLKLLRELQLSSYIAVPLTADGTTFGVLSLAMAESGRKYGENDFELARALADRATMAIHHARLFAIANQAQKDAEEASRAKDEFLAMLGHELRNPLAPIVTALRLMKMREPHALERERAILERQVQHVVTLVDDLLDVSRIARGKAQLAKEPVHLSETLARALELAGPLIEEQRHEVVAQFADDLQVSGDPLRLAQVLANLLTNAAKYTPKGGKIEISATREADQIHIRVRDNGCGIDANLLPHVFDLFTQAKQDRDRAKGGLGLGLAIVRSVVELHGGKVSVKSGGQGLGSEFEIVLPAFTGELESSPIAAPIRAAEPTHAEILVVDDNDDARDLLAEALTLMGYRVLVAGDAAMALSIAERARPVAALLDIGLPVMDGYELARRLRATTDLEKLKLIAVTGYGQPTDRERTRKAGFDEHLVKPVSMEAVQRAIERLLGGETRP